MMDATKELQELLIKISAEITDKKIEDTRIQALSLPRKIVNSLESGGYIMKDQLSAEQLLTYAGFLKADAYQQINHALVMVHPYDDLIIIKRYCNKLPEVIKIEWTED